MQSVHTPKLISLMNTMTSLEKTTQFTQLNLGTVELDQNYMAKSRPMKKADYIAQLQLIIAGYGSQLSVKQLKKLIAKYA